MKLTPDRIWLGTHSYTLTKNILYDHIFTFYTNVFYLQNVIVLSIAFLNCTLRGSVTRLEVNISYISKML